MALNLVFVLLLLGHVLGDFYFQNDNMAEKKDKRLKYLVYHSGVYAVCVACVLSLGAPLSLSVLYLFLPAIVAHFVIDLIKGAVHRYQDKAQPREDEPQEKTGNAQNDKDALHKARSLVFIADQLLHIASLIIISLAWGKNIPVYGYLSQPVLNLPAAPAVIILGLLCILKPVGILIGKGILWDFGKQKTPPDTSRQNAGRMIGYLERIIVFLLLLYKQYSAIAFVLTAKSVARFKEIENDKNMAEYYLIGTLLSVVSAFVVALLLGLLS